MLVSLDGGGQGGSGEGPEEGCGDGHQLEGQNVRGPACRGGHDDLGGQKGQGGHDRHLQGLVWEGQGGAKLTLWAAGERYWTADKAGGWGPPDQNPVGQA